jgi:hypothetical protein
MKDWVEEEAENYFLFCNTKKPLFCSKNYYEQLMASNRVEFIRGGE